MSKCNLCVIKLNIIINRKWLYLCSEARRDKPPGMWPPQVNGSGDVCYTPRQPALGLPRGGGGGGQVLFSIPFFSLFQMFWSFFSSVLGTVSNICLYVLLHLHLLSCFFCFAYLLFFFSEAHFSPLGRTTRVLTGKIKTVHWIFSQNRCWVIDPIKWLPPETSFTPGFFMTPS